MKIEILKEIIKKKSSKEEFAVLTNLSNGNSEIFNSEKTLSKDFENYKNEIENHYNLKKNGIIDKTQIFILNYIRPIEVIIVGAVHIAQYLIDLLKILILLLQLLIQENILQLSKDFKMLK